MENVCTCFFFFYLSLLFFTHICFMIFSGYYTVSLMALYCIRIRTFFSRQQLTAIRKSKAIAGGRTWWVVVPISGGCGVVQRFGRNAIKRKRNKQNPVLCFTRNVGKWTLCKYDKTPPPHTHTWKCFTVLYMNSVRCSVKRVL